MLYDAVVLTNRPAFCDARHISWNFSVARCRFESRIAWIHDAEEWELGINPGGCVAIQEVESIPEHYKNMLITDDDLLINIIDEHVSSLLRERLLAVLQLASSIPAR